MNAAPQPNPAVRESLVVLTHDQELLQTLQAVASEHDISVVSAEADLASHLLQDHAGVAILDTAAVVTPISRLTESLKAQFPDLVLVVAGHTEDQAAVAAQVTQGTVYRFLHKPVSEQRVRLFVNAAWRRHGEEQISIAESQTVPVLQLPEKRSRTGWIIAGAAAGVVLLATIGWLAFRGNDDADIATVPGPAASTATPGAPADPQLERLLARADEALRNGALVEPKGESAADLYAEALKLNAEDLRAREGLNEVVDRLLTAAEKALLDQQTDEAERLVSAARDIQPDHVRVAFLTTQIGKERERALLAEARRAASSGNIERAISVLDNAARGGQRSTLVAEARNEFAQQQVEDRVREFLNRANERMRRGALVEPAQDNARFFIESARAVSPDDPGVRQAQRQLQNLLVTQARDALASNNVEQAQRWISAADDTGVSRDEITALARELQRVQVAMRASEMARLSSLFNQRLTQGRLIDPANDSAKFYLNQLSQSEANHPSTQQARTALTTRMLEEARGSIARQDYAGARRWLTEARAAGADETRIAALDREIAAAQEAAERVDEVVPATALKRVRYVDPEYPSGARERGLSGWVELEFTVNTDGGVSDVNVTAAEPTGVFEQAAMSAVRRWRFEPVRRDGAAIEQRARIRIRFSLQN
jgi:TonB family protein